MKYNFEKFNDNSKVNNLDVRLKNSLLNSILKNARNKEREREKIVNERTLVERA